ncbi:MAG: ABC-type transport system substrate-binding protein [Kiritimatiellia bacterium]
MSIAPSMRPEVWSSEVAGLRRYDLRSWWFIAVNTLPGTFADERVRQAVDLSLDRGELREHTIGVDPRDVDSSCQFISGPFVPSSPFNNRQVPVRSSRDLGLAAERLTQAGASKVAGVWQLKGEPIVARLGMHATLESEAVDLLNQVGNQLRSAGIDASVSKVSAEDWTTKVIIGRAAEDYDLVLGKWSFGVVEDVGPLFHTRQGGRGQLNIFNYSDAQVDLLLHRYDSAKTDFEAAGAYHDLHAALATKLPYIYLWKLDTMSAWRVEVKGVDVAPYFYFTQVDGWK